MPKRCKATLLFLRKFYAAIAYNMFMVRVPLKVIELCDEDGKITPLAVVYDGREYRVQKVLCAVRHAPQVECLAPTRFDCIINGVKKSLFRDAHPSSRWFSVRREPYS